MVLRLLVMYGIIFALSVTAVFNNSGSESCETMWMMLWKNDMMSFCNTFSFRVCVGALLCYSVSYQKVRLYSIRTHYRPFGSDLYGTWCSRTTGVYRKVVFTSLSNTAFLENLAVFIENGLQETHLRGCRWTMRGPYLLHS